MSSVPTTEAIDDAELLIRRERRELADEMQAFEAFIERVAGLEPERPRRTQRPVVLANASGLSSVRDAFAETVMTVPHYAEVYDEPLLEHLDGELGEELASAIATGSQFHPELKRSLLAAGRQAVMTREHLLEYLDAEMDALERARGELEESLEELASLRAQPIERLEFNVLRLTRARLESLEDECDSLAAERQEEIRRRKRATIADVDAVGPYLYETGEYAYPVLATIAELGEEIERTKRRIDRRLMELR